MLITAILVWTPVIFLYVLYVKTQHRNDVRFAEINGRRKAGEPGMLPESRLRENIYSTWIFQRVCGVYIAAGTFMGNCFSPAIVFVWHGRSKPRSSHESLSAERLSRFNERMQAGYAKRLAEKRSKPVEWSYAAWATITLRFKGAETRIYWRGWWRLDYNSEHIARRWGTSQDAPHGTIHTYRGWMGSHQDV